MSHFLDRLMFFKKDVGTFSDGHGIVTREDRTWEDAYRKRWAADRFATTPSIRWRPRTFSRSYSCRPPAGRLACWTLPRR